MKVKNRIFLGTSVVVAVLASALVLNNRDLCDGFLPDNTMRIPVGVQFESVGENLPGGLTEEQFNHVIDRVEKIYTPDIEALRGRLQINRKWTDATVNANASQPWSGGWIINMYGGLARHPAITEDGFTLVLCHEMGHHMGGAPKIKHFWGTPTWASNEGEADYFASLKCMRRVFANDDNELIVRQAPVDALARERCEHEYTTTAEQNICQRISMAGMSVTTLFADLSKDAKLPEFTTPDASVVSRTNNAHPASQCRLDTYFNGAVCNVPVTGPLSNSDATVGTCNQPTSLVGFRPLCWYKP